MLLSRRERVVDTTATSGKLDPEDTAAVSRARTGDEDTLDHLEVAVVRRLAEDLGPEIARRDAVRADYAPNLAFDGQVHLAIRHTDAPREHQAEIGLGRLRHRVVEAAHDAAALDEHLDLLCERRRGRTEEEHSSNRGAHRSRI